MSTANCPHSSTVFDRCGATICRSCGAVSFRRPKARVDAILDELLAAPKRMATKLLAPLLVLMIVLVGTTSEANPGVMCDSTRQCSKGEVCIADCPSCSLGHCMPLHVLNPNPRPQ